MSQSLLVRHQLRSEDILIRKNINRTSVEETDLDYMRKGWHVVLIIVIIDKKGLAWLKKKIKNFSVEKLMSRRAKSLRISWDRLVRVHRRRASW